jgi:hypothetical protein
VKPTNADGPNQSRSPSSSGTGRTADEMLAGDTAVTEGEAARLLGLSGKTLRNWRSARRDGPIYLKYGRGGAIRYRISDLLAWRDAHRRSLG